MNSDDAIWIMERARFKCQRCGIGNGERDRRTRSLAKLVVMPLDGNPKNRALSNMQSVCLFCAKAQFDGAAQAALL